MQTYSFGDWIIITKTLLALTEIDIDDLVVFEDYFEKGLTPQTAAYEYTERRRIKCSG